MRRDPIPRPASRRGLRRLLPVAVAGLAVLLSACTASSADPRPAVSLSSADRTITLGVEGVQRSYLLQPAEGLDRGDAPALVVVLHQEGGTPEGVAAETALQDLRARGATLAYPAGLEIGHGVVVVGCSTDDGSSVHVVRDGGTTVLYASEHDADVAGMSRDESLVVLEHSEHGDSRHRALRVLTLDGEVVWERWDGEKHEK